MENLNDTGLSLRKISVSDWATLTENLNHNFSVLLSSPLFKGIAGNKGDAGDSTSGERGSRWIWAIWDDFKLAYGLSNQGQVTLNFINGQLTSDLQKLMDTLHTDSIISNDNIVLPSGQIITFDITLGTFKDSGMSFAQAQGITEQRVSQMINDAISGINEGSVIYEVFKAYAKNFPDTSASSGNNNQQNPDSTVDIGTPSSKPGYLLDRHKFIAPAVANMNSVQDSATFIFGVAEQYHNLIQATQNAVGQTTNEYTPGVNETTSLAILQDNYKNGIIMGYKNSATMRDFARIYRSQNGLHLASNYSTYQNEFGEIIIRKDTITLRTMDKSSTNKVVCETNFEVVNKATFLDDIIHTALNVSKANNKMTIGIKQSDMPLGITYLIDFQETPTLSTIPNQTFLATDGTGKVKGSGYSTTQSLLDVIKTHAQIPTALAVQEAITNFNTIFTGEIATLKTNITAINATISTIQRDGLTFRNTTSVPNDSSSQGIYRLTSALAPNNQVGYIINLVDTSLSTKAQFAVTATDILFRAVTGSINNIGWTKVTNKTELDSAVLSLRNRLDGHDADISQMSGQITNNYNTLNQKIDTVNSNLTTKINNDISTAYSTLRGETVQAIKGISVSGGLVKTEVGNSINIAHPTITTNVGQETLPPRLITAISTNNGHITEIKWAPFASVGELRYGMIIDLMAHYYTPAMPDWWSTDVGQTTYNRIYSNYFDSDGRGKSNALVETFEVYTEDLGGVTGQYGEPIQKNIDLSKFVLCDGRNATANLTGVITIGAGAPNNLNPVDIYGKTPKPEVFTRNNIFMPTSPQYSNDAQYKMPYQGLAIKELSTQHIPPHSHGVNVSTYQNLVQRGSGTLSQQVWAEDKVVNLRTSTEGQGVGFQLTPLSFAVFKIMFTG